jgi:Zc3h12a-like Ribonuclease NYN domain/S1 RNA binding domain
MQQDMKVTHVVVDGSNIATEGRDAPSLAQLDEAVQAFIEEYSPEHVTVVVDATFPNRIERKERKTYEDAVNANELITPPAGAIGRGDAFILQIARRAGASILSNDSFQEFHGDYPLLFERGRLIGGKPVPHVGWVFMDRAPVRGPTSRRAVSEARKVAKATEDAAEQEAVETAEAEGAAPPRRRRRARAKAVAAPKPSRAPAGTSGDGEGAEPAALAKAAEDIATEGGARTGGQSPEPYNDAMAFIEFVAAHPVGSEVDARIERFSSHGAYVMVGPARAYVPLRNLGDPPPRSAKEVLRVGEDREFVVVAVDTPRRGIDLALPGVVDVPAPDLGPAADLVAELAVDDTDASAARAAGEAEPSPAKTAAARKGAAKKAPAKKAPAKKGAAKKAPAKKAPAEKAAAKKAPAEKAAAKKAPAKKAATRKTATKKAAAERAPVEGAAAEMAPAEKVTAKKAATKKAGTKQAGTKKAAAKSAPTEGSPTRRTAARNTGAKKAAAKKAAAKRTAPPGSTRKAAALSAGVASAGDVTEVADVTGAGPAPVSPDGDAPPRSSRRSAAKATATATKARAPVAARRRRAATERAPDAELVPLASGADAPAEAAEG